MGSLNWGRQLKKLPKVKDKKKLPKGVEHKVLTDDQITEELKKKMRKFKLNKEVKK